MAHLQGRYTYNLPPLEEGPMPEAAVAGAWLPVEHLEKLADALAIGESEAERGDIKSIPDPWAQMLVFDRALFDRHHPLHKTVRTQWRALIATVALQPEFEAAYSLSVAPIDLTTAARASGESSARNLFAKTLLDLEPKRVLSPELSWRTPAILMLQERSGAGAFSFSAGQPLGFLTPTAMVAAGRGTESVRCKDVPWLSEGLADPSQAALSDRQFRILDDYIQGLWGRIKAKRKLDETLRTGLATALSEFHDEINDKAAEQTAGLVDRPVELSGAPALLQEILGHTRAFDGGSVSPAEADAALQLTGPIRTLFAGAILVDPNLESTLGKRPESITVWGRHNLADALRPTTFEMIRQEAEAAGWLVVRPDDLFTDSLVTLDGQTANEAHPRGFESSLLPLSPLALMLMPDQQIAQNLDLSPGANKATVRLKIRLQAGKTHEIRREMTRAEGEGLQVPDDLAFWPNFRAPGWRWTFLHFTASVNYYLRPRFAVTAEVITRQIQGAALDPSDRAQRMRLWADSRSLAIDELFGNPGPRSETPPARMSTLKGSRDEILIERVGFSATEQTVAEMHHLPLGADAVFFARKGPDGEMIPAGLALVKFAETNSSALRASVAIDFGTTNTVVYTDRNGTRERLTFKDRIVFPFNARNNQAQRREKLVGQYLGFFPLQDHETPLPTVAKLREFRPALPPELQGKVRDGLVHQHGFADNVFFIPNYDDFVEQMSKMGLSENLFAQWTADGVLAHRLKWGRTQAERALAVHFLRQIMMMAAAELAERGIDPHGIDWRFSYPQAFSGAEHRQLGNELRRAWSTLFGPPGDSMATGQPDFLRKTEGAAAAHFFVKQGAEKLMLVLDVGGGTTDIALWRDGTPFWRNSFKVAGGDFFTAYLANNPEVLRKIDMDEVATGMARDGLSEEGRKDFVELYVNKPTFGKRFSDNFGLLAAEPSGLGLQHAAFVALGGLMYYVGLVIGQLVADPATGLKRADLGRLTVAFAGRGATLFRQFQTGGADDELTQLVRLAVVAAGFNPSDVTIKFRFSGPNEAKHEVAQGLLIDRQEASTATESRLAVLGEAVRVVVDGAEIEVSAEQPLVGLRDASEVDHLDLNHLSQFLVGLRKLTGLHIDAESRGGLEELRAKVRQHLSDALRDLDADAFFDVDAQPFEPPFITALRELVTLMAKPLDERDDVLSVRES